MDDDITFYDDAIYREEDDGFDNYVQTTIDPGNSLFIFTLVFCAMSIVSLPLLVNLGNRRAKRRKARRQDKAREKQQYESTNSDTNSNGKAEEGRAETPTEASTNSAASEHDMNATSSADDLSTGDDLSIFSQIEKDYLCDNDKLSQGDESDSYCLGCGGDQTNDLMADILQTPFCCVGPDMRTVELPPLSTEPQPMCNEPGSAERKRKRPHDEVYPVTEISGDNTIYPYRKSSSFNNTREGKKKKSRRKKIKKAIKSMAKSKYMIPTTTQTKAPKTTVLDGGFFGQRPHRTHGVITEKQIKREEKRDNVCCNCFDPTFCVEVEIGRDYEDDISYNSDKEQQEQECERADYTRPENSCCDPLSAARSSLKIFRLDREFRRITALMLPFTITSIVSKIFEGIDIALISWRLGTESLAAYAVANYIVELAFQSLRGFTDAQATLCAHAIGAKNNHLAGQYVQLSVIAFLFCGIMLAFFVDTFTYDILIWLDMSSDIAIIGQQWASVAAWAGVINGVNEAFFQFMNVMDTDIFSNIIMMLMSAVNTFAIAMTLLHQDAALVHVGVINLGTAVLFIVINITFMASKGWLDTCWSGLVESFALKNKVATKQILKTGVPLSLGSLAREIEGGVLVVFASTMGEAEVAVFTIVRTLWDIFAACMEGICCAAEIRSAYFIGTGNISMARITTYKSLMIGVLFGALLTWGFYELFEDQVKLFTQDATLQEMMLDLVPLICIGNMAMATGTLCWSLIGAQGRFRLATLITFLSGWFITIPIAAFFVFSLNINLQGLVAAVTIGYSVSSTALMYLLIRSNWDKRVEKVKRATVEEYEEFFDSPVEVLVVESTKSNKMSDRDHYGDTLKVDLKERLEVSTAGELA